MTAAPTPASVLTLTLVITIGGALFGVWLGYGLVTLSRGLTKMREDDRPSAIPAWRREAHHARRGTWDR